MHCGNTIFVYHDEFSKYMKVDGATLEDVFDYLFNLGTKKFERNICMNYLRSWIKAMHLENDENYNDRLEDNIGDEGMQNFEDY